MTVSVDHAKVTVKRASHGDRKKSDGFRCIRWQVSQNSTDKRADLFFPTGFVCSDYASALPSLGSVHLSLACLWSKTPLLKLLPSDRQPLSRKRKSTELGSNHDGYNEAGTFQSSVSGPWLLVITDGLMKTWSSIHMKEWITSEFARKYNSWFFDFVVIRLLGKSDNAAHRPAAANDQTNPRLSTCHVRTNWQQSWISRPWVWCTASCS